MKTLCFSLGLLLLAACCCSAMPKGVSFGTASECCLRFHDRALPLKLVASIKKTHISCGKKGFIVHTKGNRRICYPQTFQWALDTFNNLTKGHP